MGTQIPPSVCLCRKGLWDSSSEQDGLAFVYGQALGAVRYVFYSHSRFRPYYETNHPVNFCDLPNADSETPRTPRDERAYRGTSMMSRLSAERDAPERNIGLNLGEALDRKGDGVQKHRITL